MTCMMADSVPYFDRFLYLDISAVALLCRTSFPSDVFITSTEHIIDRHHFRACRRETYISYYTIIYLQCTVGIFDQVWFHKAILAIQ